MKSLYGVSGLERHLAMPPRVRGVAMQRCLQSLTRVVVRSSRLYTSTLSEYFSSDPFQAVEQ